MAQLPPHRRKAVVIASSTAILASGLLLLNESRGGGGVNSWGQLALGAVVGLALVLGIVFLLKRRSGPKSGDKP
jgi:hypothetical protein